MRVLNMMMSEDIERIKEENRKLKKRAEEAEGEVTLIKGIGLNSPEMKSLRKENEKLKEKKSRNISRRSLFRWPIRWRRICLL